MPRLWRVEELSGEELGALVEEATIDAYGDDEQLSGFAAMIEDNLEMPLPEPPPKGAEWIAAHRHWARFA
jgi:hypothetical protein